MYLNFAASIGRSASPAKCWQPFCLVQKMQQESAYLFLAKHNTLKMPLTPNPSELANCEILLLPKGRGVAAMGETVAEKETVKPIKTAALKELTGAGKEKDVSKGGENVA